MKEATHKAAHHNDRNDEGKGLACKAKGSWASLVHTDRSSLPSVPGAPH